MRKLKKVLTSGILSLGILVATTTSAFADVSGWQSNGSDSFRMTGNPSLWTERIGVTHPSYNWARIIIPAYYPNNNDYNATLKMTIWEDDESGNPPEKVATHYFYGERTKEGTWDVDVSNFQDGTNNLAELYVQYEANFSTTFNTYFYWQD